MQVQPVAIGRGLSVFGALDAAADLKLTRSKAYGSGVLGVYYERTERTTATHSWCSS